MFGSAANPYDDVVIKATDENLASEDWALNIDVCDRVTGDGQTGARNAVAALQKRLAHRNPNVQLYALELANSLVQNCGKVLHAELSSRNFTGALDRLVNERATAAPVQKKALIYIKSWAQEFEESRDPNLGMMSELYDQLRTKNFNFDEQEAAPAEDREDAQRRREEEELQRVLELSKQDKGGRGASTAYQTSAGSGSNSSAHPAAGTTAAARASYHEPAAAAPPAGPDPDRPLDINTATRVRALYHFASPDITELDIERGDLIKVLGRGYREWWTGACKGKIGVFPVTYVEAMPEPTPEELHKEAQEEARVFASLGRIERLIRALNSIDTAQGQRLDDQAQLEEDYQACVALQGPINALIKKFADQKAELEHMNAALGRAVQQFQDMTHAAMPVATPAHHGYASQAVPQDPYGQQAVQGQYAQHQQPQQAPYQQIQPAQPHQAEYHPAPAPALAPAQQPYYQQNAGSSLSLHRVASGAPSFPPQEPHRQYTEPGAAGIGAGAANEHPAAWDAYYRQQAQQGQAVAPEPHASAQGYAVQQQQAAPQLHHQGSAGSVHGYPQAQPYGQSPYPAQGQGQQQPYNAGVDNVAAGMGNMSVRGQ